MFILLAVTSCLFRCYKWESLGKSLLKFQLFPTFSFVEEQVGSPNQLHNTVKSLQHESQIQINVSVASIFKSLKAS